MVKKLNLIVSFRNILLITTALGYAVTQYI